MAKWSPISNCVNKSQESDPEVARETGLHTGTVTLIFRGIGVKSSTLAEMSEC
jgi:hypothetical protein